MTTRTVEREQFLADIISAAVEGGTGYWAQVAAYKWHSHVLEDGGGSAGSYAASYAVLIPEDDDEMRAKRKAALAVKRAAGAGDEKLSVAEAVECGGALRLDIDAVAQGIGKIKRGEVTVGAYLVELIKTADRENDAGDIDAEAADVITQVALLGEIVYG